MKNKTSHFWQTSATAQPIERRVVWQFGDKRGELGLSIAAAQPIPDLAKMSEKMTAAATVQAAEVLPGKYVAPQFVFALIGKGTENGDPIVMGPGHREIPVIQLGGAAAKTEAFDFETHMKNAEAAMPPAVLAAGDHAVGFLVRRDVLFFYPIAAIGVPEEVESYREGAGSTADLIHVLPFQS